MTQSGHKPDRNPALQQSPAVPLACHQLSPFFACQAAIDQDCEANSFLNEVEWTFWRSRSRHRFSTERDGSHRPRSISGRLKEASWSATYSSAPRENAALDRIEDFQAFVAIVEKGSLTAAAKQLGRSLQSV